MLNPNKKIAKSGGIDLPILYVYLAGRISGEHIEKCLGWRNDIIKYYQDYKGKGAYPIAFLSPLNSGEANSVDKKGLTSSIPPNLIYDKDILSVERADVVIANMEDFFEEGIKTLLNLTRKELESSPKDVLIDRIEIFQDKILNRRENMGTHWELAIAHYLKKPIILIAPERRQEIFRLHPFTKRASVIVTSVEQLFKEKWLQTLYKSIAGAIY